MLFLVFMTTQPVINFIVSNHFFDRQISVVLVAGLLVFPANLAIFYPCPVNLSGQTVEH